MHKPWIGEVLPLEREATNLEDKYAAAIKSVKELPSLILKSSLSIIIAHAMTCLHDGALIVKDSCSRPGVAGFESHQWQVFLLFPFV